jgi:hypothetical protein
LDNGSLKNDRESACVKEFDFVHIGDSSDFSVNEIDVYSVALEINHSEGNDKGGKQV